MTTGCSCTTPGCPVPSPREGQPCHVHDRHPQLGPEPSLLARVLDSLRAGFAEPQWLRDREPGG